MQKTAYFVPEETCATVLSHKVIFKEPA